MGSTIMPRLWLAATLLASPAALAQEAAPNAQPGGTGAPRPGQMQDLATPATPKGVEIGEIHWYPVEAQCRFFTPARRAAFAVDDPATWRFAFITMVDSNPLSGNEFERGYVMANGLMRELEKGRTAPNRDGDVVTVWRSAGEPRINVNMSLKETGRELERTVFEGAMTLFWGDRQSTVEVVGGCGS